MNYVKHKAGANWDKLLHKVFNEHIGVIIMMLSVITLSKRENISEYNSSLENIEGIDKIK
jgi:hypothetical protein